MSERNERFSSSSTLAAVSAPVSSSSIAAPATMESLSRDIQALRKKLEIHIEHGIEERVKQKLRDQAILDMFGEIVGRLPIHLG